MTGTEGLGVLNMVYFTEFDTLYFTTGLEQTILLKLDARKNLFKVETFYPQFYKRYYEKFIKHTDDFLLFRNSPKTIDIFEKVGEGGPLLLGVFEVQSGDKIVDFSGFSVGRNQENQALLAVLENGWVSSGIFHNTGTYTS